jgi:ketosteroid isomerase-like protein
MPKPTTSSGTKADIAAANEKFVAAFSRGDAASIAALYAKNAQVLPPNNDLIADKQAIQTFWQNAMNMGTKAAKLETLEVESYGDTASELGKYTLQGEAGQEIDIGKYIVIWKLEGGQWKLHRDIWNSSRPIKS